MDTRSPAPQGSGFVYPIATKRRSCRAAFDEQRRSERGSVVAFPLVPGRGVGITMAPLQQVKLALANYLAVRGSHSGESVMCSSFVRIEGRCRTRRHPPGIILKSSVSPSVSFYFTVARPRTAHALPHSRPPPACHARLLPAAPRVKHKFQREYSATRSRGRLNYIASEVVLSPGFSPSMQGDPCRSLPLLP